MHTIFCYLSGSLNICLLDQTMICYHKLLNSYLYIIQLYSFFTNFFLTSSLLTLGSSIFSFVQFYFIYSIFVRIFLCSFLQFKFLCNLYLLISKSVLLWFLFLLIAVIDYEYISMLVHGSHNLTVSLMLCWMHLEIPDYIIFNCRQLNYRQLFSIP